MKSKKIAILFFEGYINAAPTIHNLCSYFSEHNIKVTLFTRKNSEKYNQDNSNISFSIEYIDTNYLFVRRIILSFLNRFIKSKYRKFYNAAIYFLHSFLFIKNAKSKGKDISTFDYIIGVDPIGLIAAKDFNIKNAPLIYLSLEINYLHNNSNFYTNWVKNKEKKIHSSCSYSIIQDAVRMKCLCIENDLNFDDVRYFLLPNSPRPNKIDIVYYETNYFKSMFSLNRSDFIVLSAGMISDEVHSLDVVKSFKNIGDNIVLIFHERKSVDLNSSLYMKSLLDLKCPNLYFSLNPVEYSKIDIIFRSADIGLAIYNPVYGVNYSNILFASGKISHYLKFGKPIIVNDLPGMRDFINETQCGIVINDFDNINLSILEIKNNYILYSKNAYKAYSTHFNFDKYCKQIVSTLFEF